MSPRLGPPRTMIGWKMPRVASLKDSRSPVYCILTTSAPISAEMRPASPMLTGVCCALFSKEPGIGSIMSGSPCEAADGAQVLGLADALLAAFRTGVADDLAHVGAEVHRLFHQRGGIAVELVHVDRDADVLEGVTEGEQLGGGGEDGVRAGGDGLLDGLLGNRHAVLVEPDVAMVEGEGEALAVLGEHAGHAAIDTGKHRVGRGSFTRYDKLQHSLYEQAARGRQQAAGWVMGQPPVTAHVGLTPPGAPPRMDAWSDRSG